MAVTLSEMSVPFDITADSIAVNHDDGHLLACRAVLHEKRLEALLEDTQGSSQVAVRFPLSVDDVAAQVAGEAGRDVVQLQVSTIEVDIAEEFRAFLVKSSHNSFNVVGIGFISLLVAERRDVLSVILGRIGLLLFIDSLRPIKFIEFRANFLVV